MTLAEVTLYVGAGALVERLFPRRTVFGRVRPLITTLRRDKDICDDVERFSDIRIMLAVVSSASSERAFFGRLGLVEIALRSTRVMPPPRGSRRITCLQRATAKFLGILVNSSRLETQTLNIFSSAIEQTIFEQNDNLPARWNCETAPRASALKWYSTSASNSNADVTIWEMSSQRANTSRCYHGEHLHPRT